MKRRRDFTGWWQAERAILDACLNPRAWHTPTAHCTIESMVATTGLDKRYVVRARDRLRDRGVISWTLERSRGARHAHCVYVISEDYWKPPTCAERARVARRFARRRRGAPAPCHPEVSERKARRSPTPSPSIAHARNAPQRPLLNTAGLAEHLRRHGKRVTGHDSQLNACCPAHDDHHPSLRIAFRNGRTVWHCHAGCEPLAVLEAVGLTWRDLEGYPHTDRLAAPCRARRPEAIDRDVQVQEILICDPAAIDRSPPTLLDDADWETAWRGLRGSSPYDPAADWA